MSKDGGPAFPRTISLVDPDAIRAEAFNNGLSLRDYFAAAALPKALELTVRIVGGPNSTNITHDLGAAVRIAYEVADGMLKARDA